MSKDIDYMPVNLTGEELQLIHDMIEYVREHSVHGSLKRIIWDIDEKVGKAIMYGCSKHHIMTVKFEAPEGHPYYICPKCDPKEFNKYSKLQGGIQGD